MATIRKLRVVVVGGDGGGTRVVVVGGGGGGTRVVVVGEAGSIG